MKKVAQPRHETDHVSAHPNRESILDFLTWCWYDLSKGVFVNSGNALGGPRGCCIATSTGDAMIEKCSSEEKSRGMTAMMKSEEGVLLVIGALPERSYMNPSTVLAVAESDLCKTNRF